MKVGYCNLDTDFRLAAVVHILAEGLGCKNFVVLEAAGNSVDYSMDFGHWDGSSSEGHLGDLVVMEDIGYIVIELVVDLAIGCTDSVPANFADMVAADQSSDSGFDFGPVYLVDWAEMVMADQNLDCGYYIEKAVILDQNIASPVVQN